MSRSKRKDIIKDRPRNKKKSTLYWRPIRRIFKQLKNRVLKEGEVDFKNPISIINDYDYSDYIFRDCGEKFKRK